MTNTEIEGYQRQLQVRQNRIPAPIPDLATTTFEQQFLEEVTAALERIEKGTFGCCEECGKAIQVRRLEFLPYTRFCVECVWKLQSIKEMKR